jgi:type II secretory pathway pseudopilin PulG
MELMVVVAIIMVLSGMVVLSLPRYRADALLNAATDLESALSVTRETAIAMRTPLSVTLNIASDSVSYTKPGGQTATLQFNGTIGYPGPLGNGSLSSTSGISAYMNNTTSSPLDYSTWDRSRNKDWYVSPVTKGSLSPQVWFDAFGHPNVEALPLNTLGSGSPASPCGFVTLETKGAGFVVQVLVYPNTGEIEIQWVKH